MSNINLYPESEYQSDIKHVWSWCYLHGKAEEVFDQEIPEFFCADAPMPEAGNHLVYIDGQPAVAVIADRWEGMSDLNGRIALISDTDGLRHVLNVKEWG